MSLLIIHLLLEPVRTEDFSLPAIYMVQVQMDLEAQCMGGKLLNLRNNDEIIIKEGLPPAVNLRYPIS